MSGQVLVARVTPLDAPPHLVDLAGPEGFVWLGHGESFVSTGRAAVVRVDPGVGRFARAARRAEALLGSVAVRAPASLGHVRPRLVGALPFADDAPGQLVLPRRTVGVEPDGSAWELVVHSDLSWPDPQPAVEPPDLPTRFDVRAIERRAEWCERVERAVAAIKDGWVEKVVLARRVEVQADAPFDRATVLARLYEANPGCFVYGVDDFVGATPELLVRRRGSWAESVPMAGTVRQGGGDDERLVARLQTSDKDLVEHRLVVDSVAAVLARLSERIEVPTTPSVARFATVAHLHTPIQALLAPPAPSALALAGRLHPTPAVGGVPTAASVALLRELEGFDRGCYAGPVGWVDSAGDGEWAVALRGAELHGDIARLVAGAGIVDGSDPDEEWAETQAKFEPMLRALVSI